MPPLNNFSDFFGKNSNFCDLKENNITDLNLQSNLKKKNTVNAKLEKL